jgi:hypothetical protein
MRSVDAKAILAKLDPKEVRVVPKLDVEQWKQRAHLLEAVLLQHGLEVPYVPREIDSDLENVVDAAVAFVRARFKLRQLYPSCSDQDLAKIAMQQVETASVSLKQALAIRGRPKSSPPSGMSTAHVSDRMIDQQIQAAIVSNPGLITASMILAKLDYPAHHRVRVRQRIVDRLVAQPNLRTLGKVGSAKAFAVAG